MEFFLGFLIFCAATTSALPALGSGNLSKPFMNTGHTPWNAGGVTQFPIHSSCNATQRRQIELGLAEAVDLAAHARDHILRWRNESEIYRKYFGNGPSVEAIGAFEVVVNGDKNDVLFRCDNPDGNCDLEGKSSRHLMFIGRAYYLTLSVRLRWTLARRKWYQRNSYLRSELRDSSFSLNNVRNGLHNFWIGDQYLLGL
jgi:hypothetical protein